MQIDKLLLHLRCLCVYYSEATVHLNVQIIELLFLKKSTSAKFFLIVYNATCFHT